MTATERKTWRTPEGNLVLIAKMGDRHLGNVVAMMERTGDPRLTDLRDEANRRAREDERMYA